METAINPFFLILCVRELTTAEKQAAICLQSRVLTKQRELTRGANIFAPTGRPIKMKSRDCKTPPDQELLFQALNIIEDGVHIVNKNGITVFYSTALEKIEKIAASSVIGRHISEAYQLDEESSILLKVLKTEKPIKNHHTAYFTKKGKKINIITDTFPIYSDGSLIGAISVNTDITSNRELVDTVINLQKQLYSNDRKNGTRYTFLDIIGQSPVMISAVQLARRIAVNMSPVLICGETGTGKELFAHSIHNYSLRSQGPFVAVNCSAIPATLLESVLFGTVKGAFTGAEDKAGLFEEADQGTLFLDEISSMDISLQSKLLRVLESKTIRRLGGKTEIRVNPRIISALNTDPQEAIKNKMLRQDLYYRLAVVTLTVPPLRDRTSDIPLLSEFFIQKINRIMNKEVKKTSGKVSAIFEQHSWPGNVRELQHAIEHAMNYADDKTKTIELHHIPQHLLQKYKGRERNFSDFCRSDYDSLNLRELVRRIEYDIIAEALNSNGQNITRTAKALGISRQNLQQRIKRLALK
jgi:arginine utilization regulatory protein